jgi:hypothetical protein
VLHQERQQAAGREQAGNHPRRPDRDFPVRNGQTTGSFTVTPLFILTCPGGQRVVIELVDFSGLALSGPGGLTFEF